MQDEKPKRKRGDRNLFQQIGDTMRERREVQNRETRLILLGALLVCGVIGGVYIIVAGIFNAVETNNLRTAYGDQLAEMCDPVLGGTADAANFPQTDGPAGLLVLRTDSTNRHAWHSDMPADQEASNADEVDVVVCVDEDWTELEECTYTQSSPDGDFTADTTRRQHTVSIILLNAATGDRITETELVGGMPAECPANYDDLDTGSRQFISGERVTPNDFVIWYEGIS